jgi:hypothetical protein
MKARTRRSSLPEPPLMMLNGAPWYVKIVLYVLSYFGFPVVLVLIFLMVFAGYIPSPLTEVHKMVTDHSTDYRRDIREVLDYVKASTKVQRQMCRNTASSVAERAACDL